VVTNYMKSVISYVIVKNKRRNLIKNSVKNGGNSEIFFILFIAAK